MTLTSRDLVFTPGNHRYHVRDTKPKEYIPSVTTITGLLNKAVLPEWAAREAARAAVMAVLDHEGSVDDEEVERFVQVGRQKPRDLRNEGANVGTAVHQQIKMLLVPGWEPRPDEKADGGIEAEMAMMAFAEWYDEHVEADGAKVLLCEQIVVHPSGLFCGTFDLLIERGNGELRLVDYKTTSQSDSNPAALYVEYIYQLSAYVRAVEDTPEFEHRLIHDAQVVAVGKQGQLACTTIGKEDLDVYGEAFMLLAQMFPTYRAAEKFIREANKVEKARRAEILVEG